MESGKLRLLTAVLFAMCSPAVYAQAVDHDSGEHESTSSHESEHESHQNVVSFFAGVTHTGRRKNGAALGVAYERLLNESLGVGVFAEHTFGDADFTVYAVALAYRIDRWKFFVAPGIEESDEHGTESLGPSFGKIMSTIKPRHAIAYHALLDQGTQQYNDYYDSIRSTYDGPLSIGSDLMVWNVTKDEVLERMTVSTRNA